MQRIVPTYHSAEARAAAQETPAAAQNEAGAEEKIDHKPAHIPAAAVGVIR